jgi:DNA-binding transcriptional LysR family regulator
MVTDDLNAGRLIWLNLPDAPGDDYRLVALWRRDCPPGPAQQWVRRALEDQLCPADHASTPETP